MEIKGEDFLKNVQIKQETEELEQRLTELKSTPSNNPTSGANPYEQADEDAIKVDIAEQELGDIMLGATEESNQTNKKKYLILGLVLIILFLLTIVIIRLLNNSSEDDSFTETKQSSQEKTFENDNIDQQYQKIIDEKLKTIKEQNNKPIEESITEDSLNINKIEEKEKKVEEIAASKSDVFGIKEEIKPIIKTTSQPKKEVKKLIEKISKPKNTVRTSSKASKPKGTYVQVGAFSKQPAKKYIDNIKKQGLNYRIYKVEVNGKNYNKVLIGPYNNRSEAQKNMSAIKRKLNISSAFILRF